MGFSAKQIKALRHDLDTRQVRTRSADGKELSYVEGWYVISEANRIFGFDGWNRETVESKCVLARESRGNFLAVYTAKVRITVNAGGAVVVREGHGTGQGRGDLPGEVHDVALKAAETDATKRALATFGKRFGLELYRGQKNKLPISEVLKTAPTLPGEDLREGLHPDDTTPVPRPSTFYGVDGFPASRERATAVARQMRGRPSGESFVPRAPELAPTRIDKSELSIGEPKRLRDKAHLRFVANQPCLICGRQPSDPHHLRFAQPRAIGMKVSDEFTVPLCRGHHRQLHQSGNEAQWWEDLDINALEIAKGLWEQSHAPAPRMRKAVGETALADTPETQSTAQA